jgi:hypothetical protein
LFLPNDASFASLEQDDWQRHLLNIHYAVVRSKRVLLL